MAKMFYYKFVYNMHGAGRSGYNLTVCASNALVARKKLKEQVPDSYDAEIVSKRLAHN